jgi:FkbM family methyltransferase
MTPVEICVGGYRLVFATHDDHIGRCLRKKVLYEGQMLHYIAAKIPRIGCWLDVGACIGTHSIFFATVCEMPTIAFEPAIANYRLLADNIRRNGCEDKVTAYPFAVTDDAITPLIMVCPPDNMGMCHAVPGRATDGEPLVTTVALDEMFLGEQIPPPWHRVSMIKIDVEGMECAVLRSADHLLRRDWPHLFVEHREIQNIAAISAFLTPLGYTPGPQFNATPTVHWIPPDV